MAGEVTSASIQKGAVDIQMGAEAEIVIKGLVYMFTCTHNVRRRSRGLFGIRENASLVTLQTSIKTSLPQQ